MRWLAEYAPAFEFLAAMLLAVLTAWYAVLTRRLVRGQNPACVVPGSTVSKAGPWKLGMVNVGPAVALDVRVSGISVDLARSKDRVRHRLLPSDGPRMMQPGLEVIYRLPLLKFQERDGADETPISISWMNMAGDRQGSHWLFRPCSKPIFVPMDGLDRLKWWWRRTLGRVGLGAWA